MILQPDNWITTEDGNKFALEENDNGFNMIDVAGNPRLLNIVKPVTVEQAKTWDFQSDLFKEYFEYLGWRPADDQFLEIKGQQLAISLLTDVEYEHRGRLYVYEDEEVEVFFVDIPETENVSVLDLFEQLHPSLFSRQDELCAEALASHLEHESYVQMVRYDSRNW